MTMAEQTLLIILLILQVVYLHEISGQSYFSQLSGGSICTCPSDTLSVIYECTVTGGIGTVWDGSAISKFCPETGRQILLFHSRFNSSMTNSKMCDNGTVRVQTVRVENNYTSQLTITVSPDILGDNVMCAHVRDHNGTTTTSVIGNAIVMLQTADKVYISAIDIGSRQLGFNWSPIVPDCPAIHYNIIASNCGSCLTTTNHTTVTCTDVPTNGSNCTFVVQTVVCGYISGNATCSLIINSTEIYRGTHSNKVSLSVLIVGVVCLVMSFTMIIVCCWLCVMKNSKATKSNSRSKHNNTTNYNHTSFQNDRSASENENRDTYEYGQLEEIPLDLKSLLQKLQGQISKQWYQFGLALGLPMDVLEGFNLYSEEDCLVEVLDYWLKHHTTQPTWQEITNAQSKIESFNICEDPDCVKTADKKDDIPPPKPPRRSSSVTAKNCVAPLSTTSKKNCGHEYEDVP